MKKLFLLLLLLPLSASAVNRAVTIHSPPATVTAGQSFTIQTSASTDATDAEQIGFYHGYYSIDNGANWTWFAADVNAGKSATRNAYITAGGTGSTIKVIARIAFRGGGAGDVDYNGSAINWGGSWSANQSPPAKIATISVVAPPNQAPIINWIQNPNTAYINQVFAIQSRGDDANGNLTNVNVWKEWVPFAFNGGGNGYQNFSDANTTSKNSTGTIAFQTQATDSNSATSAMIFHTTTIANRAPHSETITPSGPVTLISGNNYYMWVGNTITLTSTVSDPDGNLTEHGIYSQKVPGSSPTGTWDLIGNNTPSNAYNSSKTATHTPGEQETGRWDYNMGAADPYTSTGTGITVYVYGPTNGATYVSQSVNTSNMEAGSTRSVSVTFENSGDKPWNSDATPHKLGSQNTQDNTTWGFSRVALGGGETIVPNASKTFTFTITAPSSPGTYDFQWKMVEEGIPDWFGDASDNVQITVDDTIDPTAPLNLSTTGNTHETVSLSWDASTDNSGVVTGYKIYRSNNGSGTAIGDVTGLTFTDNGLTEDTSYNYTVEAYDAGGNHSPISNTISVTTDRDPAGDYDNDGFTNGQESAMGTDPDNAPNAGNLDLKVSRPN